MDLLSPMTVVGAIGALAVLVAGFVITLANRGSETVVLGFAAMAAASVLFVLQLFFQLRATAPTTAGVGTQSIINLTSRSVIPLHASNGVRADLERQAVEWLSTTSPRAFENPNKLGRDLAAFSILNFFVNAAVDWRMTTTAYRFPAMGRDSVITFFDYQPGESAFALSEGDLRAALRAGGNVFAEQGHVTGGRVFGYDNVRIERGQVQRRVNEPEASIVREIYERAALGEGIRGIAAALNGRSVPAPRAQRGRPEGWSASTVRAVLERPLYRGEIIFGRSAKAYGRELRRVYRNSRREKGQVPRPENTWLRVP